VEGVRPDDAMVAAVPGSKAGAASERYREAQKKYRKLLEAAARVPRLEKLCQHTWPPEARVALPSDSPTTSAAAVWSPVAAWCLLRVFADLLPKGKHPGEAFDQLYLRSELAEVFHPVGLEGDAGFRAAARVRMLLAPAKEGAAGMAWDDPDVAWLTGLHEAEGHRYFNREAHEQTLWWQALPRLVELAGKAGVDARTAMQALEAGNDAAVKAAKTAGYRLDELLRPEQVAVEAGPVSSAVKLRDVKPEPKSEVEAEPESDSIIEPSGEMSGGSDAAKEDKPHDEPK